MNTRMPPSEPPKTTTEVLRRGANAITERLPVGWAAILSEPNLQRGEHGVDGYLEITSPDQERATLILEPKRKVEGRDVAALERHLSKYATQFANVFRDSRVVIVAPYLSPPVRARLQEADLSYVDATGNMRIELTRPGLFLADRGADTDPWRGPGRPRGTLKGEPAARVVRTLVDFDRSWRMRELVETSGASTGAAYRVVEYLEREGWVERNSAREVRALDWPKLLRAWSADYGFARDSRTTRWIAPRGLPGLLSRMAAQRTSESSDTVGPYALTGTLAATEWAPYAPATLAMVYVTNAETAARTWGLQPAEGGANVILAEPPYGVMLERASTNMAGVQVAAPSQVVVDLLTGPGRSPSEAEKLLTWMEQNESRWRIRG